MPNFMVSAPMVVALPEGPAECMIVVKHDRPGFLLELVRSDRKPLQKPHTAKVEVGEVLNRRFERLGAMAKAFRLLDLIGGPPSAAIQPLEIP